MKTKPKQVTYLGARAEVWTEYDKGVTYRYGERAEFTRWIDAATPENGGFPAGTVTRRRVKGDPYKPTFQILEARVVVDAESGRTREGRY